MDPDRTTVPGCHGSPASAEPAKARTDDIPADWDERTILTTMLDYVRDTVSAKCAGLSDADARRAPLATSPLTTISGLVGHLRRVEHYWIEVVMLGAPDREPWADSDDPNIEMRMALEIPLQELLADYRARCDRYQAAIADLHLDMPSRGELSWRAEPVTLRWILLHLIEETTRHNGHIDILREMADGVTGT
jgi:uncharacterized damage-inducible protein DinB